MEDQNKIIQKLSDVVDELSKIEIREDYHDRTFIKRLIQQQIQLMSQQLQLLGHMRVMPDLQEAESPPSPHPLTNGTSPSNPNPVTRLQNFASYHPMDKPEDGGLTSSQQQYLQHLIARLTKRSPKSKQMAQDYRRLHAVPRSITNFDQLWENNQIMMERFSGSRMWDVDGNEYVDITLGFGVNFLGHSPEFVIKAVKAQLEKGLDIASQSPLAGEVAQLMYELTGMERFTFCQTGSQAVQASLRMARAVTARDKIVCFASDDHGIFEPLSAVPGGMMQDAINHIYLKYGAPESLDFIRQHADQLAAVLIEPIQSAHPDEWATSFVYQLREITAQHGIALIFDELMTGFRVHPQGVQAIYGVQPDLVSYGEMVSSGIPIGIVAGKSPFMDAIDGGYSPSGDEQSLRANFPFIAGTSVRHPLALASAKATLTFLKEQGLQLQEGVNRRTRAMVEELNAFFEESEVPIRIHHFSSWFRFDYPSDQTYIGLLFIAMLEKGLYIREGGQNCFISIAHSAQDLAFVIRVIKESVHDLQEAGFLPSKVALSSPPASPLPSVSPPLPLPLALSQKRFPLTEAQREIWLTIQLDEAASCAYNETFTIEFKGRINLEYLKKATQIVLARHEALNLRFSPDGSYQEVLPDQEIEVVCKRLTDRANQDLVAEVLASEATTPFDLINGPLVRINLLKLSDVRHLFIFSSHQIVYDGWSTSVLLAELSKIYNALSEGRAYQLPEASRFSEYAAELVEEAQSDEALQARNYWHNLFADALPVLELPTSSPRPAVKSYEGETIKWELAPNVYQAIKQATAEQNTTLFAMLFSAVNVLLSRLSGQKDIVIGTLSVGQVMSGYTNLIGGCINYLPLRTHLDGNQPFVQLLKQSKNNILDAYDHYQSSFGSLRRDLKLPRDASRLPLVEVIFNLDKNVHQPRFYGLQTKVSQVAKRAVNFELFFNLNEIGDKLVIDCDYSTALFDETTIKRWIGHFEQLLSAIAANPTASISELPLLSESETNQILIEWNKTKLTEPQNSCLHQLIEAQVEKTPKATAIIFEDRSIRYEELNRRANQLAHYLIDLGVAPGDLVGICVERSFEMLIGLLGILKAGAAYVPLDPGYPLARLAFMLEDAQVKVLVTQQAFVDSLLGLGTYQTLSLDSDWWRIAPQRTNNPITEVKTEDLAYVIYTSGSTGHPKGVQISHKNITNFLKAMEEEPGLTPTDILFAITTISFDIAALELYLPLIVGAKVLLANREEASNGQLMRSKLMASKANVMQGTPATWRMLLATGWEGKEGLKMLCGGEALPRELANQLLERGASLWNMYGPTETTVWSTIAHIEQEYLEEGSSLTISIGRPIANTQIYILDEHQQPVPLGVSGEIYIGGDGVSRGYLNRPYLSHQKFLPNLFSHQSLIYSTGDMGRYLPNGNIEFLGRRDYQIKIHGYRLELGEIEARLEQHPAVREGVVIAREDSPGDKRLVAYFVPTTHQIPSTKGWQEFFALKLPNYMIPSAFVALEALPLTPNGKVNRFALPAPIELEGGIEDEMIDEREEFEL